MAAIFAERLSPLTLGTAQLGMPYGIANAATMPTAAEAGAVFDAAWAGGVRCVDTARAYGEAETRLGEWLRGRAPRPLVITKFPPLDAASPEAAVAALDAHLRASLAALGLESVDGWLAHRAADLSMPEVCERLRALVDEGRIGAFGASAYGPDEVRAALGIRGLSLLQAPVSVFDRRLAQTGLLGACADAGIVVFARSAFLQGAVFLDPAALPAHLAPLEGPLERLREIAAEARSSSAALALGYARAVQGVASVVVGALTPAQLRADLTFAPLDPGLAAELARVADGLPEAVVDPRNWPG